MSKQIGMEAELRFMVRAVKEGFTVSQPFGDDAPYDFLIEKSGTIYRIQVKSVSKLDTSSGNGSTKPIAKFRIYRGDKSKRKLYHRDSIDYYALYCFEIDTFWVVPIVKVINQTCVSIGLNGSKYDSYKENLDL